MKRENISKAVGNISMRYIQEAENYAVSKKKEKLFKKPAVTAAVAAVLAMIIFAGGFGIFFSSDSMIVNAYVYGTDEKMVEAGAVINTGTISDDGEMTGHPLMFYLSGRNIERVRFSCKNQKLLFTDWTGKRDELEIARNFTVSYGGNEKEYPYLTIEWTPDDIIQELTDHENSTIKTLPASLKEDLIVMEVFFANGKKAVKAISISLLDDGSFFAKFDDYTKNDTDTFVQRNDALTRREVSQKKIEEKESKTSENTAIESKKHPAARKAAKKYYAGTVFKVISMKEISDKDDKIIFSVCVSKDGIIQEPDRRITLKCKGGKWKVIGEGY